ncbi:MAG: OFA family MFS transporter [Chloroflexi bacterium]|nr:MAG: OFA family MFS transporter [Chloroflexota bacterium]
MFRSGSSRRLALRVLICGLALQFVFGMAYAWGAVAPYVRLHDHWSPLLISAVFSGTPLGYGMGIIIGGWFADRSPPRRLCWIGTGLLLIGFAVAFLLPSGITFAIFYSALALGLGGSIALAGALAAGISAFPGREGMIGGTLTGSYALAAVVQIPVISYLASTIGWADALRLVGSIMALLAVAMVLLMPAVPRLAHPQQTTGAVSFLQLMRRKQVWTGFFLEITASPLGAYAFATIATYAHSLSLALWVATVAVIAVAVGNALGRIVAGAASDRFGVNRVFLVILALNLLAVILLLLPGNGVTLLLAALAAGIGFGGPAGLLSRLASASASDAPNTAFGLLFFGYALGVFAGPLIGVVAGGNTRSWFVLGSLAGIGLFVLIIRGVLARSRPEPAARG